MKPFFYPSYLVVLNLHGCCCGCCTSILSAEYPPNQFAQQKERSPSPALLSTSSISGLGPGPLKRARSSGVRRIVIPVCGFRTSSWGDPRSRSRLLLHLLRRGVTSTSGAEGPKEHPASDPAARATAAAPLERYSCPAAGGGRPKPPPPPPLPPPLHEVDAGAAAIILDGSFLFLKVVLWAQQGNFLVVCLEPAEEPSRHYLLL